MNRDAKEMTVTYGPPGKRVSIPLLGLQYAEPETSGGDLTPGMYATDPVEIRITPSYARWLRKFFFGAKPHRMRDQKRARRRRRGMRR